MVRTHQIEAVSAGSLTNVPTVEGRLGAGSP